MRALTRRLYIRLTLFSLLALIIACAAIFAVIGHFGALASAESLQRQNLGLASYLIASQRNNALLSAEGSIVKSAFSKLLREVRRINPTLEIYLIGFDGSVLAHAGEITVPLGRIKPEPLEMLGARRIAAPKLPILGDDPRRPSRKAVISVAALSPDDAQAGYLYVVLDGASAAGLGSGLTAGLGPIADSNTLNTMLALVAGIIMLASASLAWLLNSALRPLSDLTERVQAFRGSGEKSGLGDRSSDEIALLADATARMQLRIEDQFTHLEEAEQQRRELINQVTHDLQTPLASVRGYLETLLLPNATVDEQSRQTYLQTALRHTRSLSRRVTDLFELSNLQAGTTPFEPETFALAELVHDIASDYSPRAGREHAKVSVANDCVVPANVTADIGLLERALRNLLDNAIRHTDSDGVITVSIVSDAGQSKERYWLEVRDDGEGIDAESVPHIFESAWSGRQHGHRSGTSSERGASRHTGHRTGLGLHIVRQIALLHGAEPAVRSTPGQGTCISFAIPSHRGAAETGG